MYVSRGLSRWGICVVCGLSLWFALLRPEAAAQTLTQTLALCTGPLLAAVFPFLVLSRLVFVHGAAEVLGRGLCWAARLAGVRHPAAGLPILLGWTGGFSPAASAVAVLYRQHSLSAADCARLLPVCLCVGPGFLTVTVGSALGSPLLGWLLYLSQLSACLACGLVLRRFPLPEPSPAAPPMHRPPDVTVSSAIGDAGAAYGKVCSCVLFFAFLTAALRTILPGWLHPLLSLGMEVTGGCLYGAGHPTHALSLCSLAVSWLGCAAWCQLRTLLPEAIPLTPFLALRPLHGVLSLGFLQGYLRLLPPQALAAYSSLAPDIALRQRAPAPILLVLFFLLCRMAVLLSHRSAPPQAEDFPGQSAFLS